MAWRIGIFGGSFNPIHRGHTGIADALCRLGAVDEVWLMVSPLNPLKQGQQNELLDDAVRLHLARLATADLPHVHVSDFETRLPVPSYTITTLARLQEAYPDVEFVLVIGEDNWQRFDLWREHDVIRTNYDIVVYGRNGGTTHVDIHRKDGTTALLGNVKGYDVSSTKVRQALCDGRWSYTEKWLHPAVCRYIRTNHLYMK